MITFDNGGKLIQPGDDIAEITAKLSKCSELFIDFETTSGDVKLKSVNPWHNCSIAGVAITGDDLPEAYYIAIGHRDITAKLYNINRQWVLDWLWSLLQGAKTWANSNVKYDANVLLNALGGGVKCELPSTLQLADTATLARIIDSDRFTYGLKTLSKEWLGEDISKYENALQPYLKNNQDYGLIPADICGEYACQDVLTVRKLYRYLQERCPESCRYVWGMEIQVTKVLLDIEREGMRIDPQELKVTELKSKLRLMQINEEINEQVGYSVDPASSKSCFDLLCNGYGLPVLAYTETGNPSFDKHTLANYANLAGIPDGLRGTIGLMLEYRRIYTVNNLFVEPYQKLHVDGVLHPDYKQTVRTGRMACGQPNMTQLNEDAKALIHCPDGYVFLSVDYSQIEFRLIVHYMNDSHCIAAYGADPDTDFHQWVADECLIHRKPAKTVNFMIAFGGGKRKTVDTLSKNKELVDHLYSTIEHLPEDLRDDAFKRVAKVHSEKVFNKYHHTFPSLRPTAKRAENAARARGYVFNLYGRRRHLPADRAHIAFNTLNQGTAADIMKERAVEAHRRCKRVGIKLLGLVHDEFVFAVPKELFSDQLVSEIYYILEHPTVKLRVPIRVSGGYSDKTWLDASKAENLTDVKRLGGYGEFEILV